MCSFLHENKIKCMIITFLLAVFCLVSRGLILLHFAPDSFEEEQSIKTVKTSDDYRYAVRFQRVLNDSRYKNFKAMYEPELSCAIPGLSGTNVLGGNCTGMVPQGLCFCEDYMLVSAYDCGRDGKRQHSVLYVISNSEEGERAYLATIVLPDVNHVGGLAYDGKYVWIAKSSDKSCSAVEKKMIDEAIMQGKESCEVRYAATVDCGVTASFLTFYDDRLWVGTFARSDKRAGLLTSFSIGEKDGAPILEKVNELTLPCYANGVNIEKYDGKVCMAVVSSYSRVKDSTVYIYELKDDDTKDIEKIYRGRHRFPPMGEETACDGKNVYFLFESAAACYSEDGRVKCSSPVDRVCAVSMQELYFGSDLTVCRTYAGMPQVPEIIMYEDEGLSDKSVAVLISRGRRSVRKAVLRYTDKAPGFCSASSRRLLRHPLQWGSKAVT